MRHHQSPADNLDAALLDLLTAPSPPSKTAFARRDAALDPLLIAAAAASGPHVTRNHYHHDFFPGVMMPSSQGSYDWTKWSGEDASNRQERKRLTYVSRQAPRRQRLATSSDKPDEKENDLPAEPFKPSDNIPLAPKKRRPSIISPTIIPHSDSKSKSRPSSVSESTPSSHSQPSPAPVQVKCMARTRIPTPHGPAFLHLYHNNRDNKEHLAIVIDSAQFSDSPSPADAPHIRSASLDAVWSENETDMDRITRGAYVGRLSSAVQRASDPSTSRVAPSKPSSVAVPPPLIRIHSECFTGETVGSMRCDCGEQLDEAIRQISLPITIPSSMPDTSPVTIPGRGAVIYLRQEGRGIGLLSKIRAYNLQDMGHDTVTANLMLGHKADERGYEIAGAILRDLGLGGDDAQSEGVRVLTNNPDKVEALQKEGIRVMERVPMIPRSWQSRQRKAVVSTTREVTVVEAVEHEERVAGATLIGGNAVYGEDLDKYLRTKVLRMGHMLPLWLEEADGVY